MADEMRRRREAAAHAFIMRRDELGLTQLDVAARAGVAVRTIHNFENGRWPNARTRALIEGAVDWRPGEIERIADEAVSGPSPRLRAQIEREFDAPTAARILAYMELAVTEPGEDARAVNGDRS